MGQGPTAYWEISFEEAGRVIFVGIRKKEKNVYVPRKVWFIAAFLKHLPDFLYKTYLSSL